MHFVPPAIVLKPTTLFTSGSDGFHTFRIPCIHVTRRGTILVVCEGRKTGSGDSGEIQLVQRRSTDGGRSFGPIESVWNDPGNTCGNPVVVEDQRTGALSLLATWNRGDDKEPQIIDGKSKDTRRVFLMRSTDDGRSWGKPAEITTEAKQPNWTWYATGPGGGIALRKGRHRGRLVVPCDHIDAGSKRYWSHVLLSDDGGKSWRLGGTTPKDQVNECQVVELENGDLLLNMRNYDPQSRLRQVAISKDGGESWEGQRFDPALPEPICHGSIERVREQRAGDVGWIAFTNPADRERRRNLTVRFSHDDGGSWPHAVVLHAGPAAYSDMALLAGERLAVLYEAGEKSPYESIRLVVVETENIVGRG